MKQHKEQFSKFITYVNGSIIMEIAVVHYDSAA